MATQRIHIAQHNTFALCPPHFLFHARTCLLVSYEHLSSFTLNLSIRLSSERIPWECGVTPINWPLGDQRAYLVGLKDFYFLGKTVTNARLETRRSQGSTQLPSLFFLLWVSLRDSFLCSCAEKITECEEAFLSSILRFPFVTRSQEWENPIAITHRNTIIVQQSHW